MNLGLMLSTQATTWEELHDAVVAGDRLGYEQVWLWDHLLAVLGDPSQPIFEGWTALAACASATAHVRLGLMVGANTFRNPGLVAKIATTLDHVSGGRAMVGLGGAWFEPEHRAFGIDFGKSPGERLRWLDDAARIVRDLLDGKAVSGQTPRYALEHARLAPLPVQKRLPLLIGGMGERKTLRTVARYADMWNATGSVEVLRAKGAVLRRYCAAFGRDPEEIERTVRVRVIVRDDVAEADRQWQRQMTHNMVPVGEDHRFVGGTPADIAALASEQVAAGFGTFIAEMMSPFDMETIERLATEVLPLARQTNSGHRTSSRGGGA